MDASFPEVLSADRSHATGRSKSRSANAKGGILANVRRRAKMTESTEVLMQKGRSTALRTGLPNRTVAQIRRRHAMGNHDNEGAR
jgi:hypothetical protein